MDNVIHLAKIKTAASAHMGILPGTFLVLQARHFPILMGVAGSATGKKGLVSLGHIPWHLQECRQIQ